MASLDSLPADHRAVLQLVLQRGRSYDDIAAMLSIDRAAVRERALSALDALGPSTSVPPERRALITDYLLGQLPPGVREETRNRLAESPPERAWARVVASELAPLSSLPLSEIPAEGSRPAPTPAPAPEPEPTPEPEPESAAVPQPEREPEPESAAAPQPDRESGPEAHPAPAPAGDAPAPRRSSRSGGAILLVVGALVAVAVVVAVVVLLSRGSSSSSSTPAAASTTATSTSTSASTATTSAATSRPIAQVNLTSPRGNNKIGGVAVVVQQGKAQGLVIRAQGVPANGARDAYAVWLYNSPTDSRILGFVNPGVKANGVLQTAGGLPSNAAHYKQLLVTRESQARPTAPGKIVLQGALSL